MEANTAFVMIQAAFEAAKRLERKISVGVSDEAGHLIAFGRMPGAPLISIDMAVDKAYTAVALQLPTGALPDLIAPGAPLYGLEAYGVGRLVPFGGGIPVKSADELLGAVGVSGGSPEEDIGFAEAALAAFDPNGRRTHSERP